MKNTDMKRIGIIEDDWKHFQVIKSIVLDQYPTDITVYPEIDDHESFKQFKAKLIRSLDTTKKQYVVDKNKFDEILKGYGDISLYIIDQILKPDDKNITGLSFYEKNNITKPSIFLTISTQAAIKNEIETKKKNNCCVLQKPEKWEGGNLKVVEIKALDTVFNEQLKNKIEELLNTSKTKKADE
jgi:hypothetical protein